MKIEIKKYAADARKLGNEKIERVCSWIYRWGYSNRQIVAKVAGDGLDYAGRLVKKGLLSKVEHPECGQGMYVLTEDGLTIAMDKLAQLHKYMDDDLHYPFLRDKRLPWNYVKHSNLVQECMIELCCHQDIGGAWWVSERELRNSPAPRPDALFLQGENVVWIELERTSKNKHARWLQLWDRLQAVKQGKCSKVIWVCFGPGTENSVSRALNLPMCVRAIRNESSRIVLMPEAAEKMHPLRMASKVTTLDMLFIENL